MYGEWSPWTEGRVVTGRVLVSLFLDQARGRWCANSDFHGAAWCMISILCCMSNILRSLLMANRLWKKRAGVRVQGTGS